MRKLLSLLVVSSFFAFNAYATDAETSVDSPAEETYTIGAEEFTAPIFEEMTDEEIQSYEIANPLQRRGEDEWGRGRGRYRCPRGYERVPAYRWDRRRHRWVFDGFTCRRMRHRDDNWGRDRNNNDRNDWDRSRDNGRDVDDRHEAGHREPRP